MQLPIILGEAGILSSGLTTKVGWGYAFIPMVLGACLFFIIAMTSMAKAGDPSHIARKLEAGYVVLGNVDSSKSKETMAALSREGIRAVVSQSKRGRCSILAPEEEAEDATNVLMARKDLLGFDAP